MNKYTLKILSNVDCNIYIDEKLIAKANRDCFVRIELEEGEYLLRVQNENAADDSLKQKVILDKDRFVEAHLKRQGSIGTIKENKDKSNNQKNNLSSINWEKVGQWSLIIGIAILILVFGEALGIPKSVLNMLRYLPH